MFDDKYVRIGIEFDLLVDMQFSRYNVIANPLEGKLTMPKAAFFVFLIWCYTLPWAIFPFLSVWGRFVPGKMSGISIISILSES